MGTSTDVAIIGAGPYGLSLAAHLNAAGLDVRVFGKTMHFWRTKMPEGMVLKSEGFASDLWHPNNALTLQAFCAERGLPYKRAGLPIPLQTFCDYGVEFQKRFVPNLDQRWVTGLDRRDDHFELRIQDSDVVTARRVVLAPGIGSFQYIPCELDQILGPQCVHSTEVRELEPYAGKKVLIIGGGASGVELAGLMSQRGSSVTVATRQPRIAFCGPPSQRSLLDKLQAPESGLGTGWRSLACVEAPMVFYHMPQSFRHMVVRKHLGPAPGWTSRDEVERHVTVLLDANPESAALRHDNAAVTFRVSNRTRQTIEADHVIAATGFRVDVRRLNFIGPRIMSSLVLEDKTPALSPHFETSVPGLFMIGVTAANSFGPLLRFAYGAGFASRRLSGFLARDAVHQTARAEPELVAA
nr:NAD(P)-binding domain-containing protein [uncultured Rhodopila sp.]